MYFIGFELVTIPKGGCFKENFPAATEILLFDFELFMGEPGQNKELVTLSSYQPFNDIGYSFYTKVILCF